METIKLKLMTIFPLLQQVLIKVGVHRTKTGRESGLTNMYINAIRIIRDNKNCTMRQLAKELLIAPPAATRIVNDLIKKDLVERITDSSDRRIIHLTIKPLANELFIQIHVEAAELLTRILSRLTETELKALDIGLESFVRGVLEVEQEDQTNE